MCHWSSSRGKTHGCDEFVRLHMESVVGWINLRHRFFSSVIRQSQMAGKAPRGLIVYYEDLKGDFASELQRVSRYVLGASLSSKQVNKIGNISSIGKMKISHYKSYARKGETCGFAAELGQEVVAYANKVMQESLDVGLRGRWHC